MKSLKGVDCHDVNELVSCCFWLVLLTLTSFLFCYCTVFVHKMAPKGGIRKRALASANQPPDADDLPSNAADLPPVQSASSSSAGPPRRGGIRQRMAAASSAPDHVESVDPPCQMVAPFAGREFGNEWQPQPPIMWTQSIAPCWMLGRRIGEQVACRRRRSRSMRRRQSHRGHGGWKLRQPLGQVANTPRTASEHC